MAEKTVALLNALRAFLDRGRRGPCECGGYVVTEALLNDIGREYLAWVQGNDSTDVDEILLAAKIKETWRNYARNEEAGGT